ncbi:hypothetical protein [Mycolicibacterium tusciae]|uniref:hypothetical protein n=1 Tax=Mycolicibacterium tusciae TaxID=75922 RepID=UPI00024A325F|nr:hypothetical protein [Mycolicibacterium tusciae]
MSDGPSAYDIQRAVSSALTPLVNALSTMDTKVDAVHGDVGRVSTDLQTTRTELLALRDEFQAFVGQAERTANVQRSETKLGNVEAALERDYGHYNVVRRTSIGMLQAFDIGNVSNKTVQQVSEELMIQSPKYWLAPAIVGLAAWSRDNEDLATKSIEAAFERDPKKTSLFFALVLRRQGRPEAASRWLRHYLQALDPRALTREFVVILEAASQEAFGPAGRALIGEQLGKWNRMLRDDRAVVEAQVAAWTGDIEIHRATVNDAQFPHLSRTSPQWPEFKDVLERASSHGFTAEKYLAIREEPTLLGFSIQDRLDDILEILVKEFDEEELPYRREVVFHLAVIDSGGDIARANEKADEVNVAHEETLDAVSLQTQTAIRREIYGVSVSAQKIAIGNSRDDFRGAVHRYSAYYRSRYLDHVDITLPNNHSEYAMTLGFQGWTTSTAVSQSQAEASLAETWKAAVANYLESIRFKEHNYLIAGGIALIGLLFMIFLISSVPAFGVLVFVAAAGGAGFWVWRKKTESDKKYHQAQGMAQAALEFSIDIYRAAVAEFVDAKLAYSEEDDKEADLLRLIDTWPTFIQNHTQERVS